MFAPKFRLFNYFLKVNDKIILKRIEWDCGIGIRGARIRFLCHRRKGSNPLIPHHKEVYNLVVKNFFCIVTF